ncbi:MAG: hypothetical protein U9R48_09610 [Chloroflexota bacterium]|nr:hypothetical protein [Chloroflexota bacterium]
MKALGKFITVLAIPLMILNMLGGIVAGIWLAILGEWGAIGVGILIIFAATIILRFVLAPSILSDVLAYTAKDNPLGVVCFSALSSLYIIAVVTFWCCGLMFYFVRKATASDLIPRLLWSYGLATGPWAGMAKEEARGSGSEFTSMFVTFLAKLAYATAMILMVFTPITLLGAFKVFVGFMVVTLVFLTILVTLLLRETKAAE